MRAIGGVSGIGAPLASDRIGGDAWIRYIGDSLVFDMHEGAGGIIRDLSGNGNDGELRGLPNLPIWERNSLSLDGIDDYVNVPDSDSLTPQIILAFGCHFRTTDETEGYAFAKHSEYEGYAGFMPFFAIGIILYDSLAGGGIEGDDFSPPTYPNNEWHNICWLWLGNSDLEIYFDAFHRLQLTPFSWGVFNTVHNNDTDLYIGTWSPIFGGWWRVRISFIRMNILMISEYRMFQDYLWCKWRN